MVRALAAIFLVVFGLSASADAASLRLEGKTIMLSGHIEVADPLRLSQLIRQGANAIVLESPGGLVAAGAYMAQMIRKAGLKTIVRGDCASACTILYYAGRNRELTGRLGFHRATDAIGTKNYTSAMQRYGAPREAIEAVMATPSTQITWLR